jgi:N-acetylneuraminic acid mutarotase
MFDKKFVTFLLLISLVIITIVAYFENSQASRSTNARSCWTSGKNMPTARIEMGSTTVGDKIYVMGGYSDKTTNIVQVYDSTKDQWSTISPLPEKLDHLATATFNNKIYVVGGFDEESKPSNRLFIYDTVLGKWEERKKMPTARGALTAEFIDGILYAVGGDKDPAYIAGGYHPYGQTTTNEAYDPTTDSWTVKTPMPTARHHHTAAVVGERLYIIGGRYGLAYADHNFNNSNANEMYDPAQNKWFIMGPTPSSRSGAAAASLNGSIYVFGGETKNYPSGSQHTYSENEKYDPIANSWIAGQPMATGKHGLSAESINNKIFVIGGGKKPGFTVDDGNEIYHAALMGKNNCV